MDNPNLPKNRNLFVISAPSGAGKTSLVKSLCSLCPFIVNSVSFTTRKKRESETDGIDYNFISIDEFSKKQKMGDFIESQNVYGNFYGTGIRETLELLNTGKDVILEIDYKGMMRIKEIFPSAISIYIIPPDITTLEKRLNLRGQDKPEVVKKRMESSISELKYAKFADYVVKNDKFLNALSDIITIVFAAKASVFEEYKFSSKITEYFKS